MRSAKRAPDVAASSPTLSPLPHGRWLAVAGHGRVIKRLENVIGGGLIRRVHIARPRGLLVVQHLNMPRQVLLELFKEICGELIRHSFRILPSLMRFNVTEAIFLLLGLAVVA